MTAPSGSDAAQRGAFDLSLYLEEQRVVVEAALGRALGELVGRVPDSLLGPIRHGVMTGGKRLRPILCGAAYAACGGGNWKGAADLGVSVEMIHAYSLMHDDLPCMDDADLRRGEPTTHKAFGERPTVEAGAALIPLAVGQAARACTALGCDSTTTRRILVTLTSAAGAGGMVGGQFLDLMGEGRTLDPDELTDLHSRKTGALLTAPLVMGGLAAGASESRLEALRRYGAAVGLAFQVADDILDATSDSTTLGKNPSDMELDKSTYVSLYGLEEARRHAEALVERALGALSRTRIESPALAALARYTVARRS